MSSLIQITTDLSACIQESVGRCCGLFRQPTGLFGRLDQAKYILNHSFEGKQMFVDGPDGNQIDCMFFPCTQKEEIKVYSDEEL